jgi:prevent-host-death family protein
MTKMSVADARQKFSDTLNRVVYRNERIVLQRRGKDIAALISLEELRLFEILLEKQEDRTDLDEARRILADPTEKPVPYEKARKELELD